MEEDVNFEVSLVYGKGREVRGRGKQKTCLKVEKTPMPGRDNFFDSGLRLGGKGGSAGENWG